MIMDEVLEKVLSGRVVMNELKQWLTSDTLGVPNLEVIEKSEFIPFFLNHIKEKCTWLLSRNIKTTEPAETTRINGQSLLGKASNEPITSGNVRCTNVRSTELYKTENVFRKTKFPSNDVRKFQGDFVIRKFSERPKNVLNEIPFSSHDNVVKPSQMFSSPYSQKKKKPESIKFVTKSPTLAVPDVNSIDLFPPIDSKNSDVKGRRRITPTPVQAANNASLNFGHSHFSAPLEKVQNDAFKRTSIQEAKSSDFHHEREMLKVTRNKLYHSSILPIEIKECPLINVYPHNSKSHTLYVVPDPLNICFMDKISVFIEIYDLLLINALVPNITSELYFIFEILTSKVTSEDKPDDEKSIFCSIHNCVYFAVSVMEKRCDLLYMLDNSTLTSMVEIPFLFKYSPKLVSFLKAYTTGNQEVSTKSYHLKSVPFLLEEDSRKNFPDDNSFYSFKKQRDLFYELLREWQQQSLDYTNSKFRDRFSNKAKLLVNLCPDSINLYHLAKLIQSQLIASCLCFEVNEVYDELLGDIQKNFPGKIEKLQERFRRPLCVGGPTPPPTFYGIQTFFSELIHAAASPSLNQHLIDILVCKIVELNNANILSDRELSSLGTIKEKYTFLLHTLRLLGKFLGYLYFLPYKTMKPLPLSIENHQLAIRKHVILPLDLKSLLTEAVRSNKVILTVPWIVEFLSMIDSMAQNLEYIQTVLKILISIYRGSYLLELESRNFWFLRFIIGWLFDALHFPKKYNTLLQSLPPYSQGNSEIKGIDYVITVDRQLIHSCCPYLVEFKVLLYNFLNGIKRKKQEVRKITPLSTAKLSCTSSVQQQTETQLEENFFFGHPTSMRKTTEFVAERIASKVINKIRAEVKNVKLKTVDSIFKSDEYQSLCISNPSLAQKKGEVIETHISMSYEEIKSKVCDLIKFCNKDIEYIMPHLLSDDAKQPVIDICCKISFRLAVNKVIEWSEVNLTLDAIKSDIQNKVQQLSKKENDKTLNSEVNLVYFVRILKRTILKIHSKSEDVTKEHLIKMNSDISLILPKDLSTSAISKIVLVLSIDLYVALLVNLHHICDEELIENFILFWSNFAPKFEVETSFLSAHNVKFLLSSKCFDLIWSMFISTLNTLLKRGVFDIKRFETCANSLSKHNWQDSSFLKYLCQLQSILINYCATNDFDKNMSSMQSKESDS